MFVNSFKIDANANYEVEGDHLKQDVTTEFRCLFSMILHLKKFALEVPQLKLFAITVLHSKHVKGNENSM